MDVKDGFLGFAVGDALGVPVEFYEREELKKEPVVDMLEFGTHSQPKGTWSDDTSMMLATMDAIINCKGINYTYIANNFCLWASGEKFNPHDRLFDIGITTSTALNRYITQDVVAEKAGCKGYDYNGNGSLMRILPLAYYFNENPTSDEKMIEIINNVSSITHANSISCMGCYLYVKYAMSLLAGNSFEKAYENLKKVDTSSYDLIARFEYNRILSGKLGKIKDESQISSTGYVVDSLEAAIWCCLNSDNYKDATLKAVNLGGDTDTIGGLVGGLAGIKYGIKNIPKKWINDLVKLDYLEDISNKYQDTIKDIKEIGNKKIYKY